MPLRDLAQQLDEENYHSCLHSVLEHLCDIIAAHTAMRTWLRERDEGIRYSFNTYNTNLLFRGPKETRRKSKNRRRKEIY